ncbi:MAG: glycoside hydrolase N-terminal domain-containing protein [Lentisphaerae bacterium]|nr:glycoside hydrolase N-terminal domain-containing protein [Lentisphaerota bacterium]
MLNWQAVKTILARHSLSRKHAAATPWEGLLLGNADMGAIVFGPAHRLCFRLNKMDLWDARMNPEHYQQPLPLSKFKEYVQAETKDLERGQAIPWSRLNLNDCWQGHEAVYPCMRMGADLLLRVAMPEAMPVPMVQRLRLEDGLFESEYTIGWWLDRPKLKCSTFISWQDNVLALRLQIPQGCQNKAVLSLGREPWGGRSWELLSAGPSIQGVKEIPAQRDPRAGMLPAAEIGISGNTATLWQVIPGDAYCPERGFSVAAACAEQGAGFFMEPSGQAALEALDHDELTIFVALTSEMEAPDSMARALQSAREAAQKGWDRLYAAHAKAWKAYWMKSMVQLGDRPLERSWVRSAYNLAVSARSGRSAPANFGIATVHDSPPWRGDRHNDYPEFSSIFWGAFSSNHEEQARNYTEFVHAYLPTARRIAREIYECQEGAAYPVTYVDGTEMYWFHHTWGRILWLTAVHAQNAWWHYQYFGDRDFLAQMAYPVMRECATFYVELLRKNPPGDYTFWPTIATEIRGWTKDFEFNKNCIEDLAHIKFLLRAVLEASSILNVDGERRKIWQDILDHLPAYPTIVLEGKEEFVDFAGQDKRPAYNHSICMAPFWPAEDRDLLLDPRLRQIGIQTLSAHPWDHTRLMTAYMRLGMKGKVYGKMLGKKVEKGDDVNVCWATSGGSESFLINEMLLTAWDGLVRVFPVWPLEKKARFRDLRTKGAFLVSAACEAGKITELSIRSEKGNRIRLEAPWPKTRVISTENRKDVPVKREGASIEWDTTAGQVFEVAEQL